MICYLVRHGKDDDSLRGGWSETPLTAEGMAQAEELAGQLAEKEHLNLAQIFSSDLLRAKQTAQCLARKLELPVEYLSQFREANNGVLAGMENTEALEAYPGLFWNTLDWDTCYPEGESPHMFYDRICAAWGTFREAMKNREGNVLLVTHGGVINVILHIEKGMAYSNQNKPFPVRHTELIAITL